MHKIHLSILVSSLTIGLVTVPATLWWATPGTSLQTTCQIIIRHSDALDRLQLYIQEFEDVTTDGRIFHRTILDFKSVEVSPDNAGRSWSFEEDGGTIRCESSGEIETLSCTWNKADPSASRSETKIKAQSFEGASHPPDRAKE